MAEPNAGGGGELLGAGGASRIELAWELRGAEEARVATEARLRGIRSVLAVIEAEGSRVLPGAVAGWHSPAGAAYAEQLQGLHAALAAVLATLHSAEVGAWRELAGWQAECARLDWLLRRAAGVTGG